MQAQVAGKFSRAVQFGFAWAGADGNRGLAGGVAFAAFKELGAVFAGQAALQPSAVVVESAIQFSGHAGECFVCRDAE